MTRFSRVPIPTPKNTRYPRTTPEFVDQIRVESRESHHVSSGKVRVVFGGFEVPEGRTRVAPGLDGSREVKLFKLLDSLSRICSTPRRNVNETPETITEGKRPGVKGPDKLLARPTLPELFEVRGRKDVLLDVVRGDLLVLGAPGVH